MADPENDQEAHVPRTVVAIAALALTLTLATTSHARVTQTQPMPVPIPQALQHARDACPNTASIPQCRAALIHAYDAIRWQRAQNVALAREMLGNVTAWTCIHNGKGASHGTGEGSWTANTHNGYYGGLQMDIGFQRTYGSDMIRRHHGGLANTWTPREQIMVAERARASGRGYSPWPNTGRACGLL